MVAAVGAVAVATVLLAAGRTAYISLLTSSGALSAEAVVLEGTQEMPQEAQAAEKSGSSGQIIRLKPQLREWSFQEELFMSFNSL